MTKKVTKRQAEQALAIVAQWMGKQGYGTEILHEPDEHGNVIAVEGASRCECGSKYWEYDHCVDCGASPVPTYGPALTGPEAAYRGEGPELNMAWDWPSGGPTPTIIMEGGPYDWAVTVSLNTETVAKFKAAGVYAEAYSGWALCLYREES